MAKDRVMVIGSGGREHALATKLAESANVEKVYVTPGTAPTPKCENVSLTGYMEMLLFAKDQKIGLTVVGPEKPLVEGVADMFTRAGLRIFGPSTQAARLESDKAYAKGFMRANNIPTAPFRVFSSADEADQYIDATGPVYVKASGLAAGKGAIIGRTRSDAHAAIQKIMRERIFGDAGNSVVIERMLEGGEASYLALVNSSRGVMAPLLPCRDYKQIGDGGTGPNTGGMGAHILNVNPQMNAAIENRVLHRTVTGLKETRIPYCGFLYPGIMIEHSQPYVLEYNVRAGDPETQAWIPLLKSDLYVALQDTIDGRTPELRWHDGSAVCVVLASAGYPDTPEIGKKITGLDHVKDATVYHAGTKFEDGEYYTKGGRVLGVTARGPTLEQARKNAYAALEPIRFDGMQLRTDIGKLQR